MLDCPIITYNPNTPIFVDPDDPDDPLGPDITVDPPIIHPIGPFETETTAPGVSELLNE
jgi:hypothetical protein